MFFPSAYHRGVTRLGVGQKGRGWEGWGVDGAGGRWLRQDGCRGYDQSWGSDWTGPCGVPVWVADTGEVLGKHRLGSPGEADLPSITEPSCPNKQSPPEPSNVSKLSFPALLRRCFLQNHIFPSYSIKSGQFRETCETCWRNCTLRLKWYLWIESPCHICLHPSRPHSWRILCGHMLLPVNMWLVWSTVSGMDSSETLRVLVTSTCRQTIRLLAFSSRFLCMLY